MRDLDIILDSLSPSFRTLVTAISKHLLLLHRIHTHTRSMIDHYLPINDQCYVFAYCLSCYSLGCELEALIIYLQFIRIRI